MKKKENTKLAALKSQMKDMSQDYQDMIKARDESKKQLDKKFKDVYDQIEENRQFTVNEGEHVSKTLEAFKQSFEKKLAMTEDTLKKEMNEEKAFVGEQISGIKKKLDSLDKSLADEKAERIRMEEENLGPIRKDITCTELINYVLRSERGI